MINEPSSSVDLDLDSDKGRPVDTAHQLFRFVLPRTRDSSSAEDPLGLLRKRLIVVSLVFTAAPAIYAARALYFLSQGQQIPGGGWLDLVLLLGAFGLTLGLLTILVCRKRLSSVSLRTIELLGFGHAVALFSWWLFDDLRSGWLNDTGDDAVANTVIMARFWVLPIHGSIMAYGTLIPNTWRRCAIVIMCIAACPILVVIAVGLIGAQYAGGTLLVAAAEMSFWLAIAAGLAIFGAHRMEVLRRRAAEARTLGQYKLHQRLGAGGMGEVYLAEHLLLRRPCAIKLIRPDRAGEPKNLLRFLQEVQATATLTHPNTIQVFDYGHAEDGTFYYVMEYLPGITLEQLVEEYGPLPPERAIHFLRQICDALHEAHSIGLIHRDIKPSNVIICQRGGRHDRAKLLDFGLAVPVRKPHDGETLTHDAAIVGTPAYMSPEQAGGEEYLDARSDVYSLGAVAYFTLTGQSPFADRSPVKQLAAHMYETPPPLSNHQADVLPELEILVMRCLAKNPSDRFSDVSELQVALASCAGASDWDDEKAARWWNAHMPRSDRLSPNAVSAQCSANTTSL